LDYKNRYIKLFEAFKSSVLNNYKNLINSDKFIVDFKRHFQHINLHKITDDDFEYVPVNEFLDNIEKYRKLIDNILDNSTPIWHTGNRTIQGGSKWSQHSTI